MNKPVGKRLAISFLHKRLNWIHIKAIKMVRLLKLALTAIANSWIYGRGLGGLGNVHWHKTTAAAIHSLVKPFVRDST